MLLVSALAAALLLLVLGQAVVLSELDALEPRQPSAASLGVLAGRLAGPPEDAQATPVRLRFTGTDIKREVSVRPGDVYSVELPSGTYLVTGDSRQVCPGNVQVTAGGWQRHDVLWPCASEEVPAAVVPAAAVVPPGAPVPPGS